MSDDRTGSRILVDSLIAAGHRRIAVLTDVNAAGQINYQQRVVGYRQALTETGIPYDPTMVFSIPVDYDDYLHSSEHLLLNRIKPLIDQQTARPSPRPTAVFVLSDFLAFTLTRVLWNLGIPMPEHLSLASYGGWVVTNYLPVSMHTWVQPTDDILQTMMVAIRSMLRQEAFPGIVHLQTRHPDGSYGEAKAIGPRVFIVPGYLRTGQSIAAPYRG